MSNPIQFIPADDVDGYAIQALAKGEASEDQQRRAFSCIVKELCGTYDMTFDPESPRMSDFNEGKRAVGRSLVGLLTLNIGMVSEKQTQMQKQRETVKINKKRGKKDG